MVMQVCTSTAGVGGGYGDLAVADVADSAVAKGEDAAEAHAHPAARRHQHARVLAGVEKGCARAGFDGRAGPGEADRSAVAAADGRRGEPFGVQSFCRVVPSPVRLDVVEQRGGATGPRLPVGPVRNQRVEIGRGDPRTRWRCDARRVVPRRRRRGLGARCRRPRRRRSGALCTTTTSPSSCEWLRNMPMTGVMPLPAVTNSTLAGRVVGRVKSPQAWSR